MKILVRNALIFSFSLFLFTDLFAQPPQTFTTNGGGTTWNDAGSWTAVPAGPNTIPTNVDNVVIDHNLILATTGSANSVHVAQNINGASLTVNGILTVDGSSSPFIQTSIFLGNTGFLTINGTLIIGDNVNSVTVSSVLASQTNINGDVILNANPNSAHILPGNYNNGSNCIINGITTRTAPANIQNLSTGFYDFTWDCPGQLGSALIDLTALTSVANDLVIENSGSGLLVINNGITKTLTVGQDFLINDASVNFNFSGLTTITVGRNFVLDSDLTITATTFGNSDTDVIVTGNVTISDGIFDLGTVPGQNSNLAVGGNFIHSGLGEITASDPSANATILFNRGSGFQTYVNSGATTPIGVGDNIDFSIVGSSTLILGPSEYISGDGEFSMDATSTLEVQDVEGLDIANGNIRLASNPSSNFAIGATIVYNNQTADQLLGDGFPEDRDVNVVIDNGSFEVENDVFVDPLTDVIIGKLFMNTGTFYIGAGKELVINGDIENNGATFRGDVTGSIGTSSLTFGSSGTFTNPIEFESGTILSNFTNSRTTETIIGTDLRIAGTFGNGVLTLEGPLDISGTNFRLDGTLVAGGLGAFKSDDGVNTNLYFGGIDDVGSTVEFDATDADFNNITIDRQTGGTPRVTFGANATVHGTLHLLAGETNLSSSITMADGSTINKGSGTWAGVNPIFPSAVNEGYDVIYSGSSQTTGREIITSPTAGFETSLLDVTVGVAVITDRSFYINGNLNATSTFDASTDKITLNGTSVSLLGNGIIFGNLEISIGAVVTGSSLTTSVNGNWENLGGTFDPNGGIIRFDNSGDQSIDADGQPFAEVVFEGSGTKSLSGSITVTGELKIDGFAILNSLANKIDVGGAWENLVGGGAFIPGTGTVEFNGSSSQSINSNGDPFYHLIFSGTGSKTITTTALSVQRDLTINNTSVSVSGGIGVTIGRSFINNGVSGVFNPGTSTVTFTGGITPAEIGGDGNASTTFSNIVFEKDVTGTDDFEVTGSWLRNSGDFTGGVGQTVTFGGTGTITTTANSLFSSLNFTEAWSTSSDIALTEDFTITLPNGALSSSGSIVFAGTTTQNVNGTSTFTNVTLNAFSIVDFGTGVLTIEGNWTSDADASFSTGVGGVKFDGTGSVFSGGGSFGSLELASGTTTLSDPMIVTGNWTNSGGDLVPAGNLVTFNTATSNTITSNGDSFDNIGFTGAGTYVIVDALTVNGASIRFDGPTDWVTNPAAKIIFAGPADRIIFSSNSTTTRFDDVDVTTNDLTIDTSFPVQNFEVEGTLTLSSGSDFNTGSVDPANPLFTLLSSDDDPTMDGQIAAMSGGSDVAGVVRVQRFITNEADVSVNGLFRAISSPVANLTAQDWYDEFPITGNGFISNPPSINDPSVWEYNEATSGSVDLGWEEFPGGAGLTAPIIVGKGYIAFIRKSLGDFTLNQTNTVNQGAVALSLSYTDNGSPSDDGWNFLGNPYPASLNWTSLRTAIGTSNVGPIVYIKDNAPSGNGVYRQWSTSVGDINGGVENIAMGQSFWVKLSADPGAVNATESMKNTSSTTFFKIAEPTNILRIVLSDGNVSDETVFYFAEDSEDISMDPHDAFKLNNEIFNLSSISNGDNMVVNSMPVGCVKTAKLDLSYLGDDPNNPGNITDKMVPGDYNLTFNKIESFTEDVVITLFDKFTTTNTLVDISGISYGFEITAVDASFGDDRFEIFFDFGQFPLDANVTNDESVCAGNETLIYVDNTSTGIEYRLKDINGDQIGETNRILPDCKKFFNILIFLQTFRYKHTHRQSI